MSFIQETIKCKACGYQMNIVTGTFGTGIPHECPNCKDKPLAYEFVSDGWVAINDSNRLNK